MKVEIVIVAVLDLALSPKVSGIIPTQCAADVKAQFVKYANLKFNRSKDDFYGVFCFW